MRSSCGMAMSFCFAGGLETSCSINNGECAQMCLLKKVGHRCACSDDIYILVDDINCLLIKRESNSSEPIGAWRMGEHWRYKLIFASVLQVAHRWHLSCHISDRKMIRLPFTSALNIWFYHLHVLPTNTIHDENNKH